MPGAPQNEINGCRGAGMAFVFFYTHKRHYSTIKPRMPLTNFSWHGSFSGHFIALNPKEACQAPRKTELIDVRVLE
jgi:hypothetical protein